MDTADRWLRSGLKAGRYSRGRLPYVVDVEQLRADARERVAKQRPVPFDGRIREGQIAGLLTRNYRPARADHTSVWMVFLHGGYGLFGDLDLQDAYCRRLAQSLKFPVMAVDYRLAPEHAFVESVADATSAVRKLRQEGAGRVLLCGDSAGGAVALAAAAETRGDVAGLLLTNPNVDLTLDSFDAQRTLGPDLETSRFSFQTWTGVRDLADAPRLHNQAAGLPPVYIAVGEHDSLMPEAGALAEACRLAGVEVQLSIVSGAGHGFMSNPDHADAVMEEMGVFNSCYCVS